VRCVLPAALLGAALCLAAPASAQTVIYPDPPPRADSARPPAASSGPVPAAPRDTARRTAGGRDSTRTAPAPASPVDPVLARLCAGAAPGEAAPDALGIVFERGSAPAARDAAIAAVSGKRLDGRAEDQFQYAQVPAGGSEFRLRALADKLIRLPAVSEVGPVTCPALPAQPAPPTPAAQPARPDSVSS